MVQVLPIIYQQAMTENDLGSSASILLDIWIYFNLIADNILLPILVITILISKRLKRHPTFVNLCLTWIFSGVFSLLLFYTHQYSDSEPPTVLCIAQASLLFGIIPMWMVAVFALFYYVHHSLRGQSRLAEIGAIKTWLMLGGPYFFQIVFFAAALVVSCRHPDLVSRHPSYFYCSLNSSPLILLRTIFVAIWAMFILILEILLAHHLYRSYRTVCRFSTTEMQTQTRSETPSATPSVIRVLIFGIYVAFGTSVDIITMTYPESVLPQMYVATAGAVIFVLFGTQEDVLRVWFPCKLKRRTSSHRSYPRMPSSHTLPSHSRLRRSDRAGRRQQQSGVQPVYLSFDTRPFRLDDIYTAYPAPAWTTPLR